MQKLIKVNKTELDKMVLSENKDLNLIYFSVRTLKMQIEQLEKMLENQGIGYYGKQQERYLFVIENDQYICVNCWLSNANKYLANEKVENRVNEYRNKYFSSN